MSKNIEEMIRETNDENQNKKDWTKIWSSKYEVLNRYQKEVDIPKYSKELRKMLTSLETNYNYNKQDAMLVLKDILYHEYLDNIKK